MVKKKQGTAKKVAKTYRPKFAERWFGKKRTEGDELLREPGSMNTKLRVSTDELPMQYKDPSNKAYVFPPSVIVVILLIILFIVGYFLF